MTQKQMLQERVSSEWNEGLISEGGDGYWMSLKDGWTLDGASVIHEHTRKDCLRRLPDCRKEVNS